MTKKKDIKTKGLVEQMRVIRDKINIDLENMSPEKRSEYLKKMRDKSRPSVKS